MGREENVLLVLLAHRVAFGNLWQAICLLDFRLEPVETEIGLLMREQKKNYKSWVYKRKKHFSRPDFQFLLIRLACLNCLAKKTVLQGSRTPGVLSSTWHPGCSTFCPPHCKCNPGWCSLHRVCIKELAPWDMRRHDYVSPVGCTKI